MIALPLAVKCGVDNPEVRDAIKRGNDFFSDMILASTPGGREAGHTGHYGSHLWGGVGAARGGDRALQVFMKEMHGHPIGPPRAA